MKIYTSDELEVIIGKHGAWLRDEEGGERADLRNAYLRYADLSYADLRNAYLRNAYLRYASLRYADLRYAAGELTHIKSIFLDTYPIFYTYDRLQIGCERHLISEWREFDEERIFEMDREKAVQFWSKFKDFIFMLVELSPALPTGFVEKDADGS